MAEIKTEVLKTLKSNNVLNQVNQGTDLTLSFKGDFTEYNEKFVGSFTVRRASQMERLQIGVLTSQLLNGTPEVDTMTNNIATIIATLDVVLVSKPEWFDVYDPKVDYDIIEAVYLEYIQWVNSFRPTGGRINITRDS